MPGIIQIENLIHVYFKGTPLETVALSNINLMVEEGEFIALVGATGSGKSTLVQHLNGLLQPTAGRVAVFGRDVTERRHRSELWHQVGLVFQFPERQIFSATVYEDVAFGPRNMGLNEPEVKVRVHEALDVVGIPAELQFADPGTLSGGICRRVAIAGVLAMRPGILILDEPGAGLEPSARRQILNRVKRLQVEYGVTVVLITHNLDDAAYYAGRAAVLYNGSLLCSGKVEEIFTQIELLREADLDPPFTVDLAQRLAQRGVFLPEKPVTVEQSACLLSGLIKRMTATGRAYGAE